MESMYLPAVLQNFTLTLKHRGAPVLYSQGSGPARNGPPCPLIWLCALGNRSSTSAVKPISTVQFPSASCILRSTGGVALGLRFPLESKGGTTAIHPGGGGGCTKTFGTTAGSGGVGDGPAEGACSHEALVKTSAAKNNTTKFL